MPNDTRIALFRRRFQKHVRLVAWILNRHLRIVGLADDVPDHVQEVFLKGLKGFREKDPPGKFKPWLSRMTTNHAIDQLRKHATRDRFLSDADAGPAMMYVPSKEPSAEELLLEEEAQMLLHDRLLTAIGRLSDDQRSALQLRFFDDLEYPEIAERLGIPLNTAKSRTRYALDKIRRALEEAETLSDTPPSRRAHAA